jgi:hypothetical protein
MSMETLYKREWFSQVFGISAFRHSKNPRASSLVFASHEIPIDHKLYQIGASIFHDSGNRDASFSLFSVFRNAETQKGLTDP